MEQLTLEQAAGNHSRRSCVTHVELKRSAEEIDNIAFQAGAEWQKEQYKELINLMRQLIAAYDFRYSNIKPLLVGYTNEQAFEKMNKLIERLQD